MVFYILVSMLVLLLIYGLYRDLSEYKAKQSVASTRSTPREPLPKRNKNFNYKKTQQIKRKMYAR